MNIVAIVIITAAIVVPWTTISAFESSRLAGWTLTFLAIMAHVATWAMMITNKEAAFFFAAPWVVYELILSFIPMRIGENEEKAAEAAANEG